MAERIADKGFPRPGCNVQSQVAEQFDNEVVDVLGRAVQQGIHPEGVGPIQLNTKFGDLPQGKYYLHAIQADNSCQLTLVKFG